MVQTVESVTLSVVKEKEISTFIKPFKGNRVHQTESQIHKPHQKTQKLHNLTPYSSNKLLHGLLAFPLIVMLCLRSCLPLVIKGMLLFWASKAQHLFWWSLESYRLFWCSPLHIHQGWLQGCSKGFWKLLVQGVGWIIIIIWRRRTWVKLQRWSRSSWDLLVWLHVGWSWCTWRKITTPSRWLFFRIRTVTDFFIRWIIWWDIDQWKPTHDDFRVCDIAE